MVYKRENPILKTGKNTCFKSIDNYESNDYGRKNR